MLADIRELIMGKFIDIVYGDKHPNAHIKALEAEPIDIQVSKLSTADLQYACLYPSKKHLLRVVDRRKYDGKPYSLLLALGEPQLGYRSFDLSVLENYRNDPRYTFSIDDIHGSLNIKDEFFENGKVKVADQILIQSFGFGYSKKLTRRVVVVYLCYLTDLSPEHQQLWRLKEIHRKYYRHPDYQRTTCGELPERESIFSAFLEELHQVNEMARLMGKPAFFKHEYPGDKRPRDFSFLLRPTLREYNNFIQLADKLLSDNINRAFFKGDIKLEEEVVRKDKRIEVRQKGTIRLLEEWLQRIHFNDPKPKDEMIAQFYKIHSLRNPKAHAVEADHFNQRYFIKQRKFIIDAYGALRTLRLIFANHPKVRGYSGVPEWLYKAKIWTF